MGIELHLLGPPRLCIDDEMHLLNGINTAVLSRLALSNSTRFQLTRSRLAGAVWPDSPEEHARQLLSKSLYRLKRLFKTAPGLLVADGETVALHDVWTDVWAFDALRRADDIAAWQSAIDLYGGDLLEGHDVLWALPRRAELHEQFLLLLSRCAARYEAEGDLENALLTANKWTIADPLNETAHAVAMRLYGRTGRYGIALQQYKQLAERLMEELGVQPLPETQALYALMQTERQKAAAPIKELPFVGRQAERQQLVGLLEQLPTGRGGVVILEGAPGIGKTRLLEAIAQSAMWRDVRVAWGRLAENEAQSPYAPLPGLIETFVSPLWLDQIELELSQSAKRLLSHWLPALRQRLPGYDSALTSPDKFRPMPLRLAVSKLFALMGERTPGVLIFDDLQWAGAQLWEVLPGLLRLSEERPLLFILSYRPQEIRTSETAWAALRQIERDRAPLHLRLDGLEPEECRALVSQLGCRCDEARLEQLMQISNGNPLYLKEAILEEEKAAESFERTLTGRLALLSPGARRTLAVAAVLGRAFPFSLWQLCANEPIPLDELLRSRLLRETSRGLIFDHDLVRAHVYDGLSENERCRSHERVARALPIENRRLGEIAWHFEKAQAWQKAVYFYHRAADFAHQVEDVETAQQHCEKALALCAQFSADSRTVLLLRLLTLQLVPVVMLTEAHGETIAILEQESAASGDPDLLLTWRLLNAKYLIKQGKIEALETAIDAAIDSAAEATDPVEEIKALTFLALQLAASVRDTKKSIMVANRAVALAEKRPQHPHLLVKAILVRVLANLYQRELEAIDDDLRWAAALIDQHAELRPLRPELVYCEAIRAQIGGNWEAARAYQHELIALHRRSQNVNELLGALYNGCNVAMFTCQFDEAVLLAEELLATVDKHIDETDFYYLYLYQSMAIEAYTGNKQFAEANALADRLLQWATTAGEGIAKARVFSAVAVLRIDEKRYEEAFALAQAIVALEKYEASLTVRSYLLLAECAFMTGRHAKGTAVLEKARAKRKPNSISSSTIYFHYVTYLEQRRAEPLGRAYEVMLSLAEQFKSESFRRSYLAGSPFHAEIFAALAHFPDNFRCVTLPLPGDARTTVWWTIDNGERDAALLREKGKVALRRHRLKRLVNQAGVYGAVPSHADLAQALGVTVRTIERDNRELTQLGAPLSTRGSGRINA